MAQLRAEGKSVLEVDTDDHDWERAARVTADAIRTGSHDVVYQGVFVDPGGWRGVADFIVRQAGASYEVADTKLARHSKPYFLLQLSLYSEQLGRVQGRLPERMHVVLGTNDRESFRVADSSRTHGVGVRRRPCGSGTHTADHGTVLRWSAVARLSPRGCGPYRVRRTSERAVARIRGVDAYGPALGGDVYVGHEDLERHRSFVAPDVHEAVAGSMYVSPAL